MASAHRVLDGVAHTPCTQGAPASPRRDSGVHQTSNGNRCYVVSRLAYIIGFVNERMNRSVLGCGEVQARVV